MPKRIILFLFLSTIILVSCGQKEKLPKLTFQYSKTIKIVMPKEGTYPFNYHIVRDKNGRENVACLFMTTPYDISIGVYDVSSGEQILYSEMTPFKGLNIAGFKYLNKDSVFFSINRQNGLYDSLIVLTDMDMNIKQYYGLCNLPVRCKNNASMAKDSVSYPRLNDGSNGFVIMDKSLFIPLSRYKTTYESGFYKKYRIPSVVKWNLGSEAFIPYFFEFPISAYLKGDGFSSAILTIGLNGEIILSAESTPIIFQFNSNSGKSIKHNPQSNMIDSVYQVDKFKAYNVYGEKAAKYARLLTNERQNLYARLLVLPPLPNSSVVLQNKIHHGLMIMDSTFQLIAEDRIPFGIGAPVFYSDEGLWFYDYEKINMVADTHYFHLYTVTPSAFSTYDAQDLLNPSQSQNLSINPYFKEKAVTHRSALIVAIPVAKTCGPCLEAILQTLKEVRKNPHIFTYFLFENEWEAKKFKEQHNLGDYPNVTVDEKGEFTKYIPHFVNAKLLFMEKGKTVKEIQETLENEAEILLTIRGFKGRE